MYTVPPRMIVSCDAFDTFTSFRSFYFVWWMRSLPGTVLDGLVETVADTNIGHDAAHRGRSCRLERGNSRSEQLPSLEDPATT
jgi:hypothetical protein